MGSSPKKKIRPQCFPKADVFYLANHSVAEATSFVECLDVNRVIRVAIKVEQCLVDALHKADDVLFRYIDAFRLQLFCNIVGPIVQTEKIPRDKRYLVCRTEIRRPIRSNHYIAAVKLLRGLDRIDAPAKQGNVAFVRIFGRLSQPLDYLIMHNFVVKQRQVIQFFKHPTVLWAYV